MIGNSFLSMLSYDKEKRYNSMKSFFKRAYLSVFILALGILFVSSDKAKAKPGDDYSPEQAVAFADSCFKKVGNRIKANPSKKYGRELCAGYVSQCLREGGMSEDSTWYWHGRGKTPLAWRVSNLLYRYLKRSGYRITYSPKASQVNPGDVIFYHTNGGWGHVAICTGKSANGTPLINAYNNPHYHYSNWRLNYHTCVVSMETRTNLPQINEITTDGGKQISLSCSTAGATIFYTTDGTAPTQSSNQYKKPFLLTKSSNVRAIAVSKTKGKSKTSSAYINTEIQLKNGTYLLAVPKNTKKVLGVPSSSEKDMVPLKLTKKTEHYNRKFMIKHIENGYYAITLLHSGKALTEICSGTNSVTTGSAVSPASTTKSLICQSTFTGANNQKWKLSCKGNGIFCLQNAASWHYLSLSRTETGSAVTAAGTPDGNSLFKIQETSPSSIRSVKLNAPSKLKKGRGFVIYGQVSSNYKLTGIRIFILDKTGKVAAKATASPGKKSYRLLSISHKIKFGKLRTGTYTYLITAENETGQKKILIDKKFQVKK